MKTPILYSTIFAVALSATALAADDRTLGEKTSDALDKAGEKTKEAGRAVVEGSKEAGRAVAETTKKAVDVVKDAILPDADAQKVDVTLSNDRIDLPRQVAAGKTAFVVKNTGTMKQNFEIVGEGIEKRFMTAVDPSESKTLHVDLKPGSYKVHSPDVGSKLGEASITVK